MVLPRIDEQNGSRFPALLSATGWVSFPAFSDGAASPHLSGPIICMYFMGRT